MSKPDSAKANEDFSKSGLSAGATQTWREASDKPDSAAASEIIPAGEVEGKYHGQFDMKPDSASTGNRKDFADKEWRVLNGNMLYHVDQFIALGTNPRAMVEVARYLNQLSATPSGGGEWTDETVKAIFDAFWPGPFFKQVAVAYNAALRENNEKWRKEVKQFIERQHSLRDCGNDTKRLLDLLKRCKRVMSTNWEKLHQDIAAMLETGEQTKEGE